MRPVQRVSQLKKLKVLLSAPEVVVPAEVAEDVDAVVDVMKKAKSRLTQLVQMLMKKIPKAGFIVVDVAVL
jgi:hypothetical protein